VLYVSASLSSCSVSVIVGPIAKETGPGFLRGGRTAGAFGGLLNQPSSDGEKGNAAARNSFQRQFEVDHRRPAALPWLLDISAAARAVLLLPRATSDWAISWTNSS